jgi:TrmH family RNA methyltransferase
VEGLRPITSALNHAAQVTELINCPELLESEFGWELLQRAQQQGIATLEVSRPVFESISLKEGPQGLAALVRQNVQDLNAHTECRGCGWHWKGCGPRQSGIGVAHAGCNRCSGMVLVGDGTDATHPTVCVPAWALFSPFCFSNLTG